jgi:hypothetical protein
MHMKKSMLLLILVASLFGTTVAQSLRQTKRIEDNQVPVAVQLAFEEDFGQIPSGGYWTSSFTIENDGFKSIAKPLSYAFHKKSKNEKIEVVYTPDGKLESAKGLEKTKDTGS